MNLNEIKATLAMENLHLTDREEKLLMDFAKGLITFDELINIILKSPQDSTKAA